MHRLAVAVAWVLVGCGEFSVRITPIDADLRYEALILEGTTCPESADTVAATARRVEIAEGSGLGALEQRTHALAIVGRDADCVVRAFGCAVAEPKRRQSVDVMMNAVADGDGCAAAESCRLGRCSDGADAGSDGGSDADVGTDADVDADGGSDMGTGADADDAGTGLPLEACGETVAGTACDSDADCAPPFFTCVDRICTSALACQNASLTGDFAITSHVDVAIGPFGTERELLGLGIATSDIPTFLGIGSLSASAPITDISLDSFAGAQLREVVSPPIDFGWPVGGSVEASFTVARDVEGSTLVQYFVNGTMAADQDAVARLEAPEDPLVIDAHAATGGARVGGGEPLGVAHALAVVADDGQRSMFSFFAVDASNERSSGPLGTVPVTSLMGAESSWVLVHRDDGAVGAWNAMGPPGLGASPYQDLEVVSENQPAWTLADGRTHLLVTTSASTTELRTFQCDARCAEAGEAVSLFDFAVQGASFVELEIGRVLLHQRDGQLHAEFLSESHERLGSVPVASSEGAYDATAWVTATGSSVLVFVGGAPASGASLHALTTD